MSRAMIKKDNSYSEFRKKNSLSQSCLNTSLLEADHSISLIADEKTQELLSMENQLLSFVRNRSLSSKPSAKSITKESLTTRIPKKSEPQNGLLHLLKKTSVTSTGPADKPPITNRSVNFQSFNQTFQIIEESEFFNEEDNALYDEQSQNNKTQPKAQNNILKNPLQKRKASFTVGSTTRSDTKATLKQLDQMQKRLESVKQDKKIVGRNPNAKKTEIITSKPPPQKTERRLQRANSEVSFGNDQTRLKGLDLLKQKQPASRLLTRKKLSMADSMMSTPQSQGVLVPTKMVNLQQKQRLLKEFDKIKESIKNTQICADSIGQIRKMLKSIEGLVN